MVTAEKPQADRRSPRCRTAATRRGFVSEVIEMLTWKDAAATGTTAFAVVVFAASHEGWAAPLVGGSHRWAAVVIVLVGNATCGFGSPSGGWNRLFAVLGMTAWGLAIATIVTGSLTPLSLLAADLVAMWAIATARHAVRGRSTAQPA
jgi:hypothetical protein